MCLSEVVAGIFPVCFLMAVPVDIPAHEFRALYDRYYPGVPVHDAIVTIRDVQALWASVPAGQRRMLASSLAPREKAALDFLHAAVRLNRRGQSLPVPRPSVAVVPLDHVWRAGMDDVRARFRTRLPESVDGRLSQADIARVEEAIFEHSSCREAYYDALAAVVACARVTDYGTCSELFPTHICPSSVARFCEQSTEQSMKRQLCTYADDHPALPTTKPPSCLVCPITCTVFSDMAVASDGFTYEREAIGRWLQTKRTSPVTNSPISVLLFPNHVMRDMLADFWAEKEKRVFSGARVSSGTS